jgi:hypothetical protein
MYMSSPGGRTPTQFQLVGSDDQSATFESAKEGYPRRIRYWLDGGKLHARVEGDKQGLLEHEEWVFAPSERGVQALAPRTAVAAAEGEGAP